MQVAKLGVTCKTKKSNCRYFFDYSIKPIVDSNKRYKYTTIEINIHVTTILY